MGLLARIGRSCGTSWRRLARRVRQPAPCRLFLSHSGLDAVLARTLSAYLERGLAAQGFNVDVFNTSEPEHRFDLAAQPSTLDDADDALRAYLQHHLDGSHGCLMLMSPQSLAACSPWIHFEADRASRAATARGGRVPFFLPVVMGNAVIPSASDPTVPLLVPQFNALYLRTLDEDGPELVRGLVRLLERDALRA